MHHNYYFWKRYFLTIFVPSVEHVADTFLNRLLLTFSSVEEEAEALSDEKWKASCSRPCTEAGDIDLANDAELAEEAGAEYYILIKNIEQGILNSCAVFLYHVYEQHRKFFYRKEVLARFEKNDTRLFEYEKMKKRFDGFGIDTKAFPCWDIMDELRLVANTVKHAEINSTDELRKRAPKLFQRPGLKRGSGTVTAAGVDVFTPLLGEDIFVTTDDIRRYLNAIKQFWQCVAEQLYAL